MCLCALGLRAGTGPLGTPRPCCCPSPRPLLLLRRVMEVTVPGLSPSLWGPAGDTVTVPGALWHGEGLEVPQWPCPGTFLAS